MSVMIFASVNFLWRRNRANQKSMANNPSRPCSRYEGKLCCEPVATAVPQMPHSKLTKTACVKYHRAFLVSMMD